MTRKDRFWAKVDKTGADGCWVWTACTSWNGYGRFGRSSAHRFAYETYVGPIPAGLTIDHLCRNRLCVRPSHLEAVTRGENSLRGVGPPAVNARKTHCIHGHEFNQENTRYESGGRHCATCNRDRKRRARESAQTKREVTDRRASQALGRGTATHARRESE